MMTGYGSPDWSRLYGWTITYAPASTQPPRFASPRAAAGSAVPPAHARPPVDQRPVPAKRPRPELAWLTWQTPAQQQAAILFNLRQTLDWRAQFCRPLTPPDTPVERERFGLLGETLQSEPTQSVCDTLGTEVREMIRTLEERQPVLERNHHLAMHSVRLGQLCAELEARGVDALEAVRARLNPLWAE